MHVGYTSLAVGFLSAHGLASSKASLVFLASGFLCFFGFLGILCPLDIWPLALKSLAGLAGLAFCIPGPMAGFLGIPHHLAGLAFCIPGHMAWLMEALGVLPRASFGLQKPMALGKWQHWPL